MIRFRLLSAANDEAMTWAKSRVRALVEGGSRNFRRRDTFGLFDVFIHVFEVGEDVVAKISVIAKEIAYPMIAYGVSGDGTAAELEDKSGYRVSFVDKDEKVKSNLIVSYDALPPNYRNVGQIISVCADQKTILWCQNPSPTLATGETRPSDGVQALYVRRFRDGVGVKMPYYFIAGLSIDFGRPQLHTELPIHSIDSHFQDMYAADMGFTSFDGMRKIFYGADYRSSTIHAFDVLNDTTVSRVLIDSIEGRAPSEDYIDQRISADVKFVVKSFHTYDDLVVNHGSYSVWTHTIRWYTVKIDVVNASASFLQPLTPLVLVIGTPIGGIVVSYAGDDPISSMRLVLDDGTDFHWLVVDTYAYPPIATPTRSVRLYVNGALAYHEDVDPLAGGGFFGISASIDGTVVAAEYITAVAGGNHAFFVYVYRNGVVTKIPFVLDGSISYNLIQSFTVMSVHPDSAVGEIHFLTKFRASDNLYFLSVIGKDNTFWSWGATNGTDADIVVAQQRGMMVAVGGTGAGVGPGVAPDYSDRKNGAFLLLGINSLSYTKTAHGIVKAGAAPLEDGVVLPPDLKPDPKWYIAVDYSSEKQRPLHYFFPISDFTAAGKSAPFGLNYAYRRMEAIP